MPPLTVNINTGHSTIGPKPLRKYLSNERVTRIYTIVVNSFAAGCREWTGERRAASSSISESSAKAFCILFILLNALFINKGHHTMPLKIYHIFQREREKSMVLFRSDFSFTEESADNADQYGGSRYYGGSDYAGYCCSRSRLAARESVVR